MIHQPSSSHAASYGPRVLLYERQALVRQGLRCLLEQMGLEVVAEVAVACDIARAWQLRPGIVVADQSCVADLAKLLKTYPAMRFVVLTDDGAGVEVQRLGYEVVSKYADAVTLSNAIWRVFGETNWELPEGLVGPESLLTARELELLQLLATGRTNKEIGSALGVTEKTVRQRLTVIFELIEVRNRTEAALYVLGHRAP